MNFSKKTFLILLGQIFALLGGLFTNFSLSNPQIPFMLSMEIWGTFLIVNFWMYIFYKKIPPEDGTLMHTILARASIAWLILNTLFESKVWAETSLIGNSILNSGFNYYYWGSVTLALIWFFIPFFINLYYKWTKRYRLRVSYEPFSLFINK